MAELLDYFPMDDKGNVEDGYTLEAYINGIPLIHNPHRIKFRPTPSIQRAVIKEVCARSNELVATERLQEVLAEKIQSWDLKLKVNDTLVDMPIEVRYIRSLEPVLQLRLFNIVVWSLERGDPDPAKPVKEAFEDDIEAQYKAIVSEKSPIDAVVEDDQKNFEKG